MKKSLILINSLSAVGLVAGGYFVGKKVTKKKTVYAGTLWVDESEPNGQPGLYLELNNDVNEIVKTNVVQFKVVKKK